MDYIENLKWDSDFFGYKVAQISNKNINDDNLKTIINKLKNQNYRLVYIKVPHENSQLNELAIKNRAFLADKKVTFSIKLNPQDNFFKYKEIIDYKDNFVSDELLNLAFQCGEYSRFKIDKNFKNHEFQNLYKIWIDNSVKKKIADKVYTYNANNKIAGMITLSKKENLGNIGLIGVDTNFRGQSIGLKLMEHSKNYFKTNNIYNVNVVTQLDNKIACNFYKKCGFKISKIENIYHLWIF